MKNAPPLWYRSRHYLHFDRAVGKDTATSIVSSPDKVAKHAFYPFIRFFVSSVKIKHDKQKNELVRKEKHRPIAYASHLDSHIYAYYAEMLSGLYEAEIHKQGFQDSVLAFRRLGKSNIEFAKDAFDKIKASSPCHVIALDVKGFFDNLNHRKLKEMWGLLLNLDALPADHFKVFKAITSYSYVDKVELYGKLGISIHNPKCGRSRICTPSVFRNEVRSAGLIKSNPSTIKGIPQGSPISALLSNVYMLEVDKSIHQYVVSVGGSYLRYCDDILIIVPIDKKEEAIACALSCISSVQLEIQTDKKDEVSFTVISGSVKASRPLQYLGFMFDGGNVFLRSASLARYSEHMRRGVTLSKLTMDRFNSIRMKRGRPAREMYRRSLYRRYSYLGRRNFISYGYRAAQVFGAKSIKKQLRPLWGRLVQRIEKVKK